MQVDNDVVDVLRRRFVDGSSFHELIDELHGRIGATPYSRGHVMRYFVAAFRFSALELNNVVFACEIFGDGATVSLEVTDQRFREAVLRRDPSLAKV